MRPIKFRAWDERQKNMHYDCDIIDGCVTADYTRGQDGFHSLIPMQFAGLLDKNGKEIYEGDILKVNQKPYSHIDYLEEDIVGVVVYCEDLAMFRIKLDNFDSTNGISDSMKFRRDHEQEREVIGNIYQHKHLLNEK